MINPAVPTPVRRSVTENERSVTGYPGIPVYIYIVSISSLLTIIGILWDIAWHRSIGRDKFLTPPHILIYLGAIFGGLFSGIQVIWNSLHLTAELKASLVRVWGIFYSSLGGLFCIWGAIAMLTSAPFDNWWHSAYGLDVKILSPPHVLLGLGIMFLSFGACVGLCKYINTAEVGMPGLNGAGMGGRMALLQFLFVIAASSLFTQVMTLISSFVDTRHMRTTYFYQVSAFVALLFLPALGRGMRMKWGMTAITFGYFLIAGVTNWIVQIFPAEPKLGPILTHTTHFQPANFPLLLFIPAAVMDIVMSRLKGNEWKKALLLSVVFVFVLLAVQYPFSGFLLESPSSRNWFFGGGSWYYLLAPDWPYRYKFRPEDIAGWLAMVQGLGIAVIIGVVSARISLRWGLWMQRIQR
jgi:hypothetical protein